MTKVYWGEFDPYEVKIIKAQDGEWTGSKQEN